MSTNIDSRGIKITTVQSAGICNKCMWCREQLLDPAQVVGIPVKFQAGYFQVEGSYCSFECAYASLIKDKAHNVAYQDSESYLLYVFRQLHPNRPLKPAHSWTLHANNGGPLSAEVFSKNTNRYYDSGRLICVPSAREYIVK